MIVIVEGIDRVGKTTLVKKLVEKGFYELDLSHLKVSNNLAPEVIELIQAEKNLTIVACLRLMKEKNIVIDRFHVSEYVYGINRGYTARSSFTVDKLLKEIGALLVYVYPIDINVSSKEHGDDLRKDEIKFKHFIYFYNTLPLICCNFSHIKDHIKEIVERIWRKQNVICS